MSGGPRRWVLDHVHPLLFAGLSLRNRFSRRSVLGSADVVVSLASFGPRLDHCFQAVETIARGRVRPRRLVLWISDLPDGDPIPATLRRLERRGLEVHWTDSRVSHTKYFPYVMSVDHHVLPLVTADDDCYYSRDWLADLLSAHRLHPDDICAHRCRTMTFEGRGLAPYVSWPLTRGVGPTPRHFLTGVSGVIYPPAFLEELKRRGESYRDHSPRSDDVWLNYVATITGTPIRQLRPVARDFLGTWGSGPGLFVAEHSVTKDQILHQCYGEDLIATLADATP
ncbi:MAG: hypothetical protein WCG96_09865 [Actinomycetes bacterium]